MTRDVSEHFRSDGRPKRAYETMVEAQTAVIKQRQIERTMRRLSAYRCGFCGKFHVGHGKKIRRQ